MNTDERNNLRGEIQDRLLNKLNALLKSDGEFDPAELKTLYGLKLAEKDCENMARRNEIAERKLAGDSEEREFTVEETVEGIQAMLGKGEAQ
jgi:hypothetical protein